MRFRWDWEHAWIGILYIAACIGVLVGVTALAADHRILYYEISQPDQAKIPTYCVYADRNWEGSTLVGCFGNVDQALSTLTTLNDELRKTEMITTNAVERTNGWANRFEDAAKELEKNKVPGVNPFIVDVQIDSMNSIAEDLRQQAKEFGDSK